MRIVSVARALELTTLHGERVTAPVALRYWKRVAATAGRHRNETLYAMRALKGTPAEPEAITAYEAAVEAAREAFRAVADLESLARP